MTNLANLLRLRKRIHLAQTLYTRAFAFRKMGFSEEESGVLAIQTAMEQLTLSDAVGFGAISSIAMPFRQMAFERHWLMDDSPEFNDLGRLNAAARLTFLLSLS